MIEMILVYGLTIGVSALAIFMLYDWHRSNKQEYENMKLAREMYKKAMELRK